MQSKNRQVAQHQCPFNNQCVLINQNQSKMPGLIHRVQENYCTLKSCFKCARFCVYRALGIDAVPELMLPTQTEWAKQIIEEFDDVPAGK